VKNAPTKGAKGCFVGKGRSLKATTESYVNAGNKCFVQLPNEYRISWDNCAYTEMDALVQDGLAGDDASCWENRWRVGAP
jgi:hypothetical protein